MQMQANAKHRFKDNYMNKTLERARSHADKLKQQNPSRARQEELNRQDYEECKKEDEQAIDQYYTRPDQLKEEYLDRLKTL